MLNISSSHFLRWLLSDLLAFVCHIWGSHNQEWKLSGVLIHPAGQALVSTYNIPAFLIWRCQQ